MRSETIRNKFIEFFEQKGHQHIPAAPIVNKADPALLFTNAGMNQFKDFFLDHQRTPHQRATSAQPCLRVSGKHNDLEEVGTDTYHHTLFEMLGNWSFGDYFKREAIAWAWELLTVVYQLPKERLYVTVFGGDAQENLEPDQETYTIWKQYMAEDRILYGSKKDNFWKMGDTGPCGPSSEIHIDLRPETAREQKHGRELVNTDHRQVIEIWNIVFVQYNCLASGQLVELPAKHVDTGMGLERLAMVLQGKDSTYDTDLFVPLIQAITDASGQVYGQDAAIDTAMKVVADHVRAVAFAIADGQIPTNTRAGYVIRRILRRAVRYGHTYLGFEQPFMYQLVGVLAQQFIITYPAIQQQQAYIEQIMRGEEKAFLKTLATGLHKLEHISKALQEVGNKLIDGATVFELYDTCGFPLDLTRLIAQEKGLQVDEQGFAQALQVQRVRSQQAAIIEQGDWHVIPHAAKPVFVGYDQLEADAKLVRYRTIKEKGQQVYQLVLDQTPFYPEGGGQVGDTGKLIAAEEEIAVLDTKKEYELILHYTKQLPKNLKTHWRAVVDAERRKLIANNHTATHLLQAALRQVLGSHVEQRGSLVNEHVLRFDFSHYAKISPEDLRKIEHIVNQKIRANIPLQEHHHIPLETAKAMGAAALFGEQYGKHVRVITFDPAFSIELCGGTHVPATGQLGFFKIITESAIAAGTRRIEALTAEAAESFINRQLAILDSLRETMKQPKDLVNSIQHLLEERAVLRKDLAAQQAEQARSLTVALHHRVQTRYGISVCIEKVKIAHVEALKQVAFELKGTYKPLFVVLAAAIDKKPHIAVLLSEDLLSSTKLNAHEIVKELARPIKGGGGGQPCFATAGGKYLDGLEQVLIMAQDILQQHIKK